MYYICGPTGVGKTSLAISLAIQLGGEVIGADAFQLYQGLPLLTVQPSKEEQPLSPVPYHLTGILPLTEECDAVKYRTLALPLIEKITSQGHVPLVTGGTGFYIKALISPLDVLPPVNITLRHRLAGCSHDDLLAELRELDPDALTQIDIKNRRRVERALEIVLQTGKPLALTWKKKERSPDGKSPTGLFLIRDRDDLYERIEKNVHHMFQQGVVEEVAALNHLSLSRTASLTLGLREIQAYLRGEITLEATITSITQATKRYAKRQMTWFRNQHSFPSLNLSCFSSTQAAVDRACELLQKK